MQSIKELEVRVSQLTARLNQLQNESHEKQLEIDKLRREQDSNEADQVMSKWFNLELCALNLATSAGNAKTNGSEKVLIAELLSRAEFEKVIYDTSTAKYLFTSTSPQATTLLQRIESFITQSDDGALMVMFIGAALLQLYVQANWTGPPVACLSDPARYPLPYMPRESELSHGSEAIARLELEAKATAAATGKDKTVADLDMYPRLHSRCINELEVNGELLSEGAKGIHFLQLAKILIRTADEVRTNRPTTSRWWRARCATVHQESLNTRDIAFDLKTEAEHKFEQCLCTLERLLDENEVNKLVLAMLTLEMGVSSHKFQEPNKAKIYFAKSLDHLKLNVKLSGALGKRTKFQIEEKTQLVLLATSERTKAPEEAVRTTIVPSTEGEAAGFGTMMEAGHIKIKVDEVDTETPLHERIQITASQSQELETQRRGHLHEIDQVAILNLCIDVKNSYAMERLTAEEMLAYCERATENPDNWTIHGCALLIKSKLEFERYKTKERSVLQMQMLVDQQTNRLTPLQYRMKDIEEDSAKPLERLKYMHALVWPPVWRLKRSLADRYKEVGVVGSALNLYQELRIWEDAVSCLVQMDKRNRAETLIRERLTIAPTPNLYVTLGELTKDESLLEKAWEFSNCRYARAKRLLGAHAYDRGDYAKAKEHLSEALEVNAQFVWAWFRLGAAAMRLEDWTQGKQAYARVVSLEPEDPEAWANLSACLARLNEVEQAFRAIQEASKFGFGNARIWDSLLTLSLKAGQWDSALLAMDTLIDLEGRKAGAPRVDVRALLPLTDFAIKRSQFRPRFEQLIAKIKAKCQSQADVWALLSEYFSAIGKLDEKRDVLVRRCRALTKDPEWFKEFGTIAKVVLTALALCTTALDQKETTLPLNARRELVTFVNGFLDKMASWRTLDIEDLQKRDMVEDKLDKLATALEELSIE